MVEPTLVAAVNWLGQNHDLLPGSTWWVRAASAESSCRPATWAVISRSSIETIPPVQFDAIEETIDQDAELGGRRDLLLSVVGAAKSLGATLVTEVQRLAAPDWGGEMGA
jgi:hypothetical protein